VNTEIDDLKNAVVKMIKAGVPVFFGCDVGQHSDSSLGIMDTNLFNYEVCLHSYASSLLFSMLLLLISDCVDCV
jgi:aminopeptidase C